jgi:endonuclease YncB( thermonuclease family)
MFEPVAESRPDSSQIHRAAVESHRNTTRTEGVLVQKAIDQFRSGTTVGYAALGLYGKEPGSVRRQVHDGDTVTVRAASPDAEDPTGNFGVRFLGVDTPEVSLPLPGRTGFTPLYNDEWDRFLRDPFADELPPFEPPLDPGLLEYLRSRVGEEAAGNHYRHAKAAEEALEAEVTRDLEALGETPATFRFFLVFAYEIMDRYGRFLCYLNRLQPDEDEPEQRPRSYNERLLEAGKANPYFIWPNVDPFRKTSSLVSAVPEPDAIAELAGGRSALGEARSWVRAAREAGRGVFSSEDRLLLQAFELRFLSRQSTVDDEEGERAVRRPPDRWVIDLTKDDGDLLPPQEYHTITYPEDRLFVPAEYVPLFAERGWWRGGE